MKKIIPAEDLALPDILTAIETECWRTSSMLYCNITLEEIVNASSLLIAWSIEYYGHG